MSGCLPHIPYAVWLSWLRCSCLLPGGKEISLYDHVKINKILEVDCSWFIMQGILLKGCMCVCVHRLASKEKDGLCLSQPDPGVPEVMRREDMELKYC